MVLKLNSRGMQKSAHLSDRLCQKTPRRYFIFTFSLSPNGTVLEFNIQSWVETSFELSGWSLLPERMSIQFTMRAYTFWAAREMLFCCTLIPDTKNWREGAAQPWQGRRSQPQLSYISLTDYIFSSVNIAQYEMKRKLYDESTTYYVKESKTIISSLQTFQETKPFVPFSD